MNDVKKQIGERINVLRKARGLTQSELAERVNLDSHHISRLETGRYFPSMESLVAIAHALDVELLEFFLFPSAESEREMREALTAIVNQAQTSVLRELLSHARNLDSRARMG